MSAENGNATVGNTTAGYGTVFANGAGNAGVSAVTTGAGNVVVNGTAGNSIGNDGELSYGIFAQSQGNNSTPATGGNVFVNNLTGGGNIAVSNAGDPGQTAAGIYAGVSNPGLLGTNASTVTVLNSSNISVTTDGASTAATYGIRATTAGIGTVAVTNSGNIDPPVIAMSVTGGGALYGNNTGGDVSGNTGISVVNTGSGLFTTTDHASVNVSVTGGNITSLGGGTI